MSNTFRPRKTCEKGAIEIGRLNTILIVLIVVILIGLIFKEIETPLVDDQTVLVQAQAVAEADPTVLQDHPGTGEGEQVELPKPESEPDSGLANKKQKKIKGPSPVTESQPMSAEPLAESQAPSSGPMAETQASHIEPEHVPQKDQSRNTMVFSIWSVSELRLRSAYTKLMNDGSIAPAQVQLTKKEYLSFVNKRTRKCGELDDKFASNINTMEKLTFNEKNVKILECHTSENIIELDRLNHLNTQDS